MTGLGIPRISPLSGHFVGGIHTRYGSFSISRYPSSNMDTYPTAESENEDKYRPPAYSRNKWYRRRTKPSNRSTGSINAQQRIEVDSVLFMKHVKSVCCSRW